jgi:iron-sulfur cluster repair protein YtfE (RIC family)
MKSVTLSFSEQALRELNPQAAQVLRRFERNTETQEEQGAFLLDVIGLFEEQPAAYPAHFHEYSIQMLVEYLQASHKLYQDVCIPEIEQRLYLLAQHPESREEALKLLLWFSLVRGELMAHMLREELHLFPAAMRLAHGVPVAADQIMHMLEGHDDSFQELLQIAQHPLLHTGDPLCAIIREKLETFHTDLKVHAIIEEDVLVRRMLEQAG